MKFYTHVQDNYVFYAFAKIRTNNQIRTDSPMFYVIYFLQSIFTVTS